jgi:hypothetical protein
MAIQTIHGLFFCQGPEVQREAIEKFRPKPGTTNVSGLLAPGFLLVGGWAQCGRRML